MIKKLLKQIDEQIEEFATNVEELSALTLKRKGCKDVKSEAGETENNKKKRVAG